MRQRTRGFVAYDGPSLLGPEPVVLVFTAAAGSHNRKTGKVWQGWIFLRDVPPNTAIRQGLDASICGGCVHRSGRLSGRQARTCYVSLYTLLRVWKTYQRGSYSRESASGALTGQTARLTAYGDPAALPYSYWAHVLPVLDGWLGYTHEWRRCDQRMREFFMASVDSVDEMRTAQAMRWRTFRTMPASAAVETRTEFRCPASDEMGHRTTCVECQLCRGTSSPAKSVAIELHGIAFKKLQGRAMIDRRLELADIESRLTRGRVVEIAATDNLKTRLALRMKWRRRGQDPGTLRQKLTGDGRLSLWLQPK